MRFKHVARVGVELEGGWWEGFKFARVMRGLKKPASSNPWNLEWHSDGSVQVRNEYYMARSGGADGDGSPHAGTGLFMGEGVCNPPQLPGKVVSWVRHNHPRWVNDSCGMHVHMSFKALVDYERIMERDFAVWFEKEMAAWGKKNDITYQPFWQRLRGDNQYCQPNSRLGEKITSQNILNHKLSKSKVDQSFTKYYQLNFGAWKKYQTMECRLLPMFPDPKLSSKAVYDLICTFERYLNMPYEQLSNKRSVRITESLMSSIQEAKDSERVIRIESGTSRDSIFRFEESESLISDKIVRTTQDPNLRVNESLPINAPIDPQEYDPPEDD
jgi:hypothetical protein